MQPGVTGFRSSSDDFGQQDIKKFEACLYPLLRVLGATIVHKELSLNGTSFYTYQLLTGAGERYSILLHAVYPFVAFASVVDYAAIVFIQKNLDSADMTAFPYRVLPKLLLDKSLTAADTGLLRDYEQTILRYWNPATIGEVIFNFWD